MNRVPLLALMLTLAGLAGGCGKGWQMDYGEPAAQFLQEDVASRAGAFAGRKITVKGTVTKIDVGTPGAAKIHLAAGITCNLGDFTAMAANCKTGDTVYVDGFLERCEEGDVLLAPAMLRDPTAPFSPR